MSNNPTSCPTVSIVMPNYNGEKYITEAIESILSQSFTDFEYIIVDDGSTDASWNIIGKYARQDLRIVALRNDENMQICETLNRALTIARGKYIARMDSDDISLPDRLALQVGFLETHETVGIVGGNIEMIDTYGSVYAKRCYHQDDVMIRKHIFRSSPFCHPAVMIRRDIFELSGLYDPDCLYAEDYDLYFRIGMHAEFANLNKWLLQYRMHDESTTVQGIWLMGKTAIRVRNKAVSLYGYHLSGKNRMYTYLHILIIYIMPGKVRIRLFNFWRNL